MVVEIFFVRNEQKNCSGQPGPEGHAPFHLKICYSLGYRLT